MKPVLAIFDLEDPQKTTKNRSGLREVIATQLAGSGRFKVVPADQVKAALAAKKKQSYDSCYAESCQIEIGNELAASHTLVGSIQRFDSDCVLTLTLYSLREAASVGGAQAKGLCKASALADLALTAAQSLARGDKAPTAADPRPPPAITDYAALAAQTDKAAKEAEAKQAAFERVRAEHLARLEKAWIDAVKVATTAAMERRQRIGVLEQFLKEYATDNPREGEAKDMLAALRAEQWEAFVQKVRAGRLKWIKSKVVKLEFTDSEVTVNQYASCVKSGKCTTNGLTEYSSCNWDKEDRGDHPINCVDWHQADAFCKAVGGRLPTDDEWFAEASNRGQWTYPWGNTPVTCDYAVWGDGSNTDGCGKNSTWPVCSKPKGNSVSGLCDMSGGVWEWMSNNENSQRPLRGGSWSFGYPEDLAAAARLVYAPSIRSYSVGFRCVRPPS